MFFREFPDGASALSAVCIHTALTGSISGANLDGDPSTEKAKGDFPQGVAGPGKAETFLSGVEVAKNLVESSDKGC